MILEGDIKLIASQVMDDVPEGGGAPTATVIADAVSNAVFPDISEMDRAGGRVSLRKLFVGVRTPNRDGYLGANVIIADPPDDPNVSVSMFTTRDTFDRRNAAGSRVEAYLNAGPEWAGFLYENHIAGQRSIQIFARTNAAPPPVGRTLLLRKYEGLPTEAEQYVRITRVQTETRTFTYNESTDYQAQIITCDISDALRIDFPGSPASRAFARASNATLLRDTVVADAGTYFGASPVTAAVAIGDVEVSVASVFTQLVPNARTETALSDRRPSGETVTVLATAPRRVEVPQAPYSQRFRVGQENRSYNWTTIVKPLPAPGTVRVTYRALGNNYSVVDNGDGTMSGAGSGTINYSTGSVTVTLQALPDDRSAVVVYWGQNEGFTNRSGNVQFRAPEYAWKLDHDGVVPGSVVITWTSGGVLKTATANAAGVISGHGTGRVNHQSGMVTLQPSAMPDSGAQIQTQYQWEQLVEDTLTGLTPDAAGVITATLSQVPAASTVSARWMTAREVSASSGTTLDSANATRTSSTSNVAYWHWSWGSRPRDTSTQVSNSATYSTRSSQTSKTSITTEHEATDDGQGGLAAALGSINYAGKTLTIKVQADWSESSYESNYERASTWENMTSTAYTGGSQVVISQGTAGGGGSQSAKGGSYGSTSVRDNYAANSLRIRYRTGAAAPQTATETFTPPAVTIDVTPYTKESIVPASVQFTWMGTTYVDFEGVVYRGRTDTNPGIESGTIDYAVGKVEMTNFIVAGSPTSFSLQSLWTRRPRGTIADYTFTTGLSPIKPGGLTISVVDVTGAQLIATSTISGVVTGPHTRGVVDHESGLVEVQFGDYVLASSLTAAQKTEWWYSADDVVATGELAGKIWRPWPVVPETLRYSAVSYFYLPLDATILGMDPVRLPQDGRVPIFRPGGFAVLGHKGVVGPAALTNGQAINCARTRLSRVRLVGADGAVINDGYAADLEAGIVNIVNVTGWSQPVRVEHYIEDMAMVAEVQIGGRVRFTRQITHAYPANGAYLSSALVAGDLRARTSLVFDQASWGNVWADAPIGSTATGTFNDTAHPIAVTNQGALTERWAVVFTNANTFNVMGEHVGVIAVGDTSSDCAPLNPASGTPYFTIPKEGWGLGWSVGAVLRFNTVGTYFPLWLVRTVQQGAPTVLDDSFTVFVRGDVDRP